VSPDDPDHPLEAAMLCVGRADAHVDELRRVFQLHVDGRPSAFAVFRDPDHDNELRLYQVGELYPVPPLASVLIGETVYDLRAALDHLVYALARRGAGGHVEGTRFPLDDSLRVFSGRKNGTYLDANGKRRGCARFLRSVPDEHVQRIGELQPASGCRWTKLLRDVSNPDRHRGLVGIRPEAVPHTRLIPTADRVRIDYQADYFFRDGNDPVLDSLQELRDQVATTIDSFRSAFSPE
jgi:hypothetical protein